MARPARSEKTRSPLLRKPVVPDEFADTTPVWHQFVDQVRGAPSRALAAESPRRVSRERIFGSSTMAGPWEVGTNGLPAAHPGAVVVVSHEPAGKFSPQSGTPPCTGRFAGGRKCNSGQRAGKLRTQSSPRTLPSKRKKKKGKKDREMGRYQVSVKLRSRPETPAGRRNWSRGRAPTHGIPA